MTERFLQFIWQQRCYATADLLTTAGESLTVEFPGTWNTHQGPDFLDAKIRIGSTLWAGHVELHIRSSDWQRHGHTGDRHYQNVILHVVWEDDRPGVMEAPVLELQGRVPGRLREHYENLMNQAGFIPCGARVSEAPALVWKSWTDRLAAGRLERKTRLFETFLHASRQHWQEAAWWWLARQFGLTQNADAFEAVARSLPLALLARHRQQLVQLEALLLGQAGLLTETFTEDYALLLHREYLFLQKKYRLRPVSIPLKFLRMRPGQFPSLRLAQLAALLHQSWPLFDRLLEAATLEELRPLLVVRANDYWHYHYRPGQASAYREKWVGETMYRQLLVNAVIPLVFAAGQYFGQPEKKERALTWLQQLSPEHNKITAGFRSLGIRSENALGSQSLLELKSEYCDRRRCLDCAVGHYLLRGSSTEQAGG